MRVQSDGGQSKDRTNSEARDVRSWRADNPGGLGFAFWRIATLARKLPLNVAKQPHGELERGAVAQRLVQRESDPRNVVRVNRAHAALAKQRTLFALEAADAVVLVGTGQLVGAQIPVPTADVGQRLRFCEKRLAASQSLFGREPGASLVRIPPRASA